MAKQEDLNKAHMDVAYIYAGLSSCVRRKVGCIVVKNDTIIAIGYNGTPPGADNCCEETLVDGTLVTKDNVIHAEQNALDKITKSTLSSVGATMYITTAPCIECAKRIAGSGIIAVYYDEIYRSVRGLDHLEDRGVDVHKITRLPHIK